MFNSTFFIDQIGNITEGSRVASFAHLADPANDIPPVRNVVTGVMPLRVARKHVGGSTPGVFVWRDSEVRIVAVAGAREPADQRAVISGWSNPVSIAGLAGRFNASAAAWSQSILNFIADDLAAASVPTWFYAYSWGGGASTILAKRMRQAVGGGRQWVVNFGSPRWCDFAAVAQFRDVCVARIFVPNDPICILPPTIEQAPFACAAIGGAALFLWQIWRFVDGGFRMNTSGEFSPAILPNEVPLPIDLNIYDFIRLSSGEGRPHNIINYRNILETAFPETSDAATDPGIDAGELGHGHAPAEPRGEPETKASLYRQVRSIINTRTVDQASDERAAARRQNRRLIRVVKEVAGWSVFIGQDRVYSATSKRDARGAANALRALSIQLGQQPNLWDQDNVIELLRSYQDV